MTKRVVLTLMAIAAAVAFGGRPARAIAPELMSYQGVLVQNNGIAVPDGVYDLRFRLLDQQTAGTVLFEQTLSAQVVHGLYNVILSSNGSYDLGDVVTQNAQLFMEVMVTANPGLGVASDVTLLPRQQLASVPYALSETPGLVSARTLRHANSANSPTTVTDWTAVPGLDGLTLDVPSAACVIEVQADIAVGNTSSTGLRVVGVRLEQQTGANYVAVRGPVVTTLPEAPSGSLTGGTATVAYVLESPSPGSYAYRVTVREDGTSTFVVSPNLGGGTVPTESTLSGKLWCP